MPLLHVVFGYSAASSLRQAVEAAGRDDEVIAQYDGFNFGPINPPDPKVRALWVRDKLGWDWEDERDSPEINFRRDGAFWHRVSTHEGRLVAWYSRRSSSEYSGFLELVSRRGGLPLEIVDLSEVMLPAIRTRDGATWGPHYVIAAGTLNPKQFFTEPYFGQVRPLQRGEREECAVLWNRLRAENADLRAISDGQIISAPIDYFDNMIWSYIPEDWCKAVRVVGDILVFESWEVQLHQQGDSFYWSRILAFIGAGKVEAEGDFPNLRGTRIKRKTSLGKI